MAIICEITKTYGGVEGRRVKAGTRFAVGQAAGGLMVITPARFGQLKDVGLGREWDPKTQAAAPRVDYVGPKAGQVVQQPKKTQSRTAAKQRRQVQADAPGEPRPLARQAGGLSMGGAERPASSSPAAPASNSSSSASPMRGSRRSAGASSTTPSSSAPGPTSSTAVTGHGGARTTAPKDSKD